MIGSAAVPSAQTSEGMIRILIFMTVLMLLFWGLNMGKHIKNGWTKMQKIADISGIILLSAMLVAFVIPLFR